MLSLYLHIPFCVRKCLYCGFYSTGYDKATADRYLEALQRELMDHAALLEQRDIGTMYIGGGTPTTLNEDQLRSLFRTVRGLTRVVSDAEVTMEMNPVTASAALLAVLKEQGVTRLSIGAQSFSDEVLAVLGRAHRAADAGESVSLARKAGFSNIALDLIYAIPGQTDEQWDGSLDAALMLGPEHLSLYGLSLDEGSQFTSDARNGKLVLPSDETAARMYSLGCDRLERAGFRRYELSNFARQGFSCRHNLNYWRRGEYLGIGAGAWSFVGGTRWSNIRDVAGYIDRAGNEVSLRAFEERPGPSEALAETIFLGLRMASGIDLSRFLSAFGRTSYESLLSATERHHATGLYEIVEGHLRLTPRGMLLANDAIEALLP